MEWKSLLFSASTIFCFLYPVQVFSSESEADHIDPRISYMANEINKRTNVVALLAIDMDTNYELAGQCFSLGMDLVWASAGEELDFEELSQSYSQKLVMA